MKRILVDSSVWIDFFKGSKAIDSNFFHECIDNNLICTNELILAELVPFLNHKKEYEVVEILHSIAKTPLEVKWHQIVEFQTLNLKEGINKVGIPDLIILQNVIDNNFKLMNNIIKFDFIQT